MKRYSIFFYVVFILTGCNKYNNVYEVDSSSVKTVGKAYEFENEVVRITYVFWGKSGNMIFSFYNKLDVPLYIDWKKSSLIRNDQKSDYWIDEINTRSKGKSSGYSSLYLGSFNNFLDFNTESFISSTKSVRPERITFLAPKSSITRVFPNLFTMTPQQLDKSAVKSNLSNLYSKTDIPARRVDFTNTNSPFRFRNFITVSTTEKFEKEAYIDNEFFVSKIYKIKRKYADPVFTYNPESKKKEPINQTQDPKRFFVEL